MTISMKVDAEWRTLSDEEHAAMCLADMRAAGVDPCERCFGVKTDGVCNWCRMSNLLNADPDYSAMSDAQSRIDFAERGPDYTYEDQQVDEHTVAAFWRKSERAEVDAATDVNACAARYCRSPEPRHQRRGRHWLLGHAFAPPPDALRLRRLYAHRAARLGLPLWSRSLAPVQDVERTNR